MIGPRILRKETTVEDAAEATIRLYDIHRASL